MVACMPVVLCGVCMHTLRAAVLLRTTILPIQGYSILLRAVDATLHATLLHTLHRMVYSTAAVLLLVCGCIHIHYVLLLRTPTSYTLQHVLRIYS